MRHDIGSFISGSGLSSGGIGSSNYLIAHCFTPVNVPNNSLRHLTLDTIDHIGSNFTLTPGDTTIHVVTSGLYLIIAGAYLDSGTFSTGYMYCDAAISGISTIFRNGVIGAESVVSGATEICVASASGGETLTLDVLQTSGGTLAIDGDIIAIRLGSA